MKTPGILAAALSVAVAGAAFATDTSTLVATRLGRDAAIVPGRWHRNFAKAKAYAEKNEIPFVAVWSNGESCPHCVKFEKCCNNSYFKNWMKTSGIVYWFGYSGDKEYGVDSSTDGAFHWTRGQDGRTSITKGGPLKNYPFVRVYWKKGKVDVCEAGDNTHGGYDVVGTTGAKKLVAWLAGSDGKFSGGKLKGFVPTGGTGKRPAYTGGEFDAEVTNDLFSRMEVETGLTRQICVYLTRTNETAAAFTGTNYLVAVSGDATPSTNMVEWTAGQTSKAVYVPVEKNGWDDVKLYLLDGCGKTPATQTNVDSRVAARVEAKANAADNPYFIGERKNLGFAEWTMDIDAATNLVIAHNAKLAAGAKKAYTLVLMAGEMWCPDCAKTDKYFFGSSMFKKWAKDNNIALCVVDIPKVRGGVLEPCLVSRKRGTASANWAKARGHEEATGMIATSGIGYLTRRNVSMTAALAAFERNVNLASNEVWNAGWKRPENNQRPGVPIFLLLRDNGTIAGRYVRLANVSPTDTSKNEIYIRRLEELLAMDGDTAEEFNDHLLTSKYRLAANQTVKGSKVTLSSNDTKDCYLFQTNAAGKAVRVTLSGDADETFNLLVTNMVDGISERKTGSLKCGLRADLRIPDYDPAKPYTKLAGVEVSHSGTGRFFADTNLASSCAYRLTVESVLTPLETPQTDTSDGGMLMVEVEAGAVYRLDGITAASAAEHFDDAGTTEAGSKLYAAKTSGSVEALLENKTLTYQKWNPGTVGFSRTGETVAESYGVYDIRVKREGGTCGTAHLTVSLTPEGSTKLDKIYSPSGWSLDGATLDWADGEEGEKSLRLEIIDNENADGTVSVAFAAAASGDAALDQDHRGFVLTIKDNDRMVPGKIGIVDGGEGGVRFSKKMTIDAKENTTVAFGVTRTGGSDGRIAATLSASAGTLSGSAFEWGSREYGRREVSLALPAASKASKVTVTLKGEDGAKLDSAAKKLVVNVLPAKAPEFEESDVKIDASRYVALDERRVKVDLSNVSDASKLKVEKVSGALPSGVKHKFDKKTSELVIAGLPTKKGVSQAVFRVLDGKTQGLTVGVTVAVSDPARDTTSVADGESPIVPNAYARTAHSYPDIMVLDPDAKRLVGLLTLTVPASGKASAKYRSVNGTVSLASKSWESFDRATGALTLALAGTTAATAGYALDVRVPANGTPALALADPKAGGANLDLVLPTAWSDKSPATAYKGYYAVSLDNKGKAEAGDDPVCLGDAYLTLKMNTDGAVNSGKFAYAGMLPNGKGVSGSATVNGGSAAGTLPFLCVADGDVFSGTLSIAKGALSSKDVRGSVSNGSAAAPLWVHAESREEAPSWAMALEAAGGIYDANENLADTVMGVFETKKLRFYAMGALIKDSCFGDGALVTAPVTVSTSVNTKKKTVTNKFTVSAGKSGFTMEFDQASGVVSGEFKMSMEDGDAKFSYQGVVMPGWGDGNCDCGFDTPTDKSRPFISGAAWFTDGTSYSYTALKGKKKYIKVRRSCPVSVGTQEGK
jgi:hypothetical protein